MKKDDLVYYVNGVLRNKKPQTLLEYLQEKQDQFLGKKEKCNG